MNTWSAGALIAGLTLASALTLAVKRTALHRNWVGQAMPHHFHDGPIPRLGGISIFLTVLILVFGSMMFLSGWANYAREILAASLAGTVVFGVGLWDDFSPIPPFLKAAIGSTGRRNPVRRTYSSRCASSGIQRSSSSGSVPTFDRDMGGWNNELFQPDRWIGWLSNWVSPNIFSHLSVVVYNWRAYRTCSCQFDPCGSASGFSEIQFQPGSYLPGRLRKSVYRLSDEHSGAGSSEIHVFAGRDSHTPAGIWTSCLGYDSGDCS